MDSLMGKKKASTQSAQGDQNSDAVELDPLGDANVPILYRIHKHYLQKGGSKGGDCGAEGFKQAVLNWSSAYYVAFSLLITVAFAMLTITPEMLELNQEDPVAQVVHYRPDNEAVDAVVQLLYIFFTAAALVDTAYGMILCAEWGVRGSVVPSKDFTTFVKQLDVNKPNRAARILLCGGAYNNECCPGFKRRPSWDPYYYMYRPLQSLFLACACFLYLSQGLPHAVIVVAALAVFLHRKMTSGSVLVNAFVDLTDSIRHVQSGDERAADSTAPLMSDV